jgi:DNA-binding transcriptional MerR regulator
MTATDDGSKTTFKAAEVCRTAEIQNYVLRYWETEFPQLAAGRSASGGPRAYTRAELELVCRLRRLLYDEGYTIAGARKKLESEEEESASAPSPADPPVRKDRVERNLFDEGEGDEEAPPAEAPKRRKKRPAPPPVSIDSSGASGLNGRAAELSEIAENLEEVARTLSEPIA